MAEEEKVPQGDSSSEETKKNKKKVIIGVSIVVALIIIFIIVLLLLLGSCTHRHTMIYHPAVEPIAIRRAACSIGIVTNAATTISTRRATSASTT